MAYTMPFFSKKNSNDTEVKARLERKLYLAREDPEPVFDLAECHLKTIPAGVFVLCRVFRKDALFLQNNLLADLGGGGRLQDLSQIQILDLRFNCLTALSQDIKHLTNLKELRLGHNRLRSLPEELSHLTSIKELEVSHNCLRKVPEALGLLPTLCRLDLRSNPSLVSLPQTLQHPPVSLVELLTDIEGLSKSVSTPIVEKLNQENKKDLNKIDTLQIKQMDFNQTDSECEKLIALLEARHKQQQALVQRLALDEEEQQHTLSVVLERHENQQALARSVVQSEHDQMSTLCSVFEKVEERSSRLAHSIVQDEEQQQVALKELLLREEVRTLELAKAVAGAEEAERARLAKVLASMPERCTPLVQMVLLDEQLQLAVLTAVRDRQEARSGQLSRCVVDEELLHQAALAAIREKSDMRARELALEVASIQAQLGKLTALEVERRYNQTTETLNDLSDQRLTLSAVLACLLQEQAKHRQTLLDEVSKQSEGVGEQLWVFQLQRLLDSMPATVEPQLPSLMRLPGGVAPLLPLVIREEVRPSAPVVTPTEDSPRVPSTPTAPPDTPFFMDGSECAVCMDCQCEVVFLPCGHVCTCQQCSLQLAECPLCRQDLTHKIRLIHV